MPVRVLHHHAGAATGRLIQGGHAVTVIYEIGLLKQGLSTRMQWYMSILHTYNIYIIIYICVYILP